MNDWNKLILGEEDSQTAPVCNGAVREMIADIDRLKGELEDAKILNGEYKIITDAHKRQSERYEDIYRREFKARQQLKAAEFEITELDGALSEVKRQLDASQALLAEARAEVERLKEIGNRGLMHCNQCDSDLIVDICDAGKSISKTDMLATARQEAARECYQMVCTDTYAFGVKRLAEAIKTKFKLEG